MSRPRIRTIKPEHLADLRVACLSDAAYRLFIGMIQLADDEGRGLADWRALKVQIFPANTYGRRRVKRIREEVVVSGLAVVYRDEAGREIYSLPKFTQHQYIKSKQPSQFPAPPEKLLGARKPWGTEAEATSSRDTSGRSGTSADKVSRGGRCPDCAAKASDSSTAIPLPGGIDPPKSANSPDESPPGGGMTPLRTADSPGNNPPPGGMPHARVAHRADLDLGSRILNTCTESSLRSDSTEKPPPGVGSPDARPTPGARSSRQVRDLLRGSAAERTADAQLSGDAAEAESATEPDHGSAGGMPSSADLSHQPPVAPPPAESDPPASGKSPGKPPGKSRIAAPAEVDFDAERQLILDRYPRLAPLLQRFEGVIAGLNASRKVQVSRLVNRLYLPLDRSIREGRVSEDAWAHALEVSNAKADWRRKNPKPERFVMVVAESYDPEEMKRDRRGTAQASQRQATRKKGCAPRERWTGFTQGQQGGHGQSTA